MAVTDPAQAATLAALFAGAQQPGQAPPAPGTAPAMPAAGGLPPALSATPNAPPSGFYAGAGAGPTNAPQPASNAGGMQDYAALAAEQQRQLMGSPVEKEAEGYRSAAQRYAGEAAATPLPQMAPQIQKGAGFLHNLGQALQMISMATGPGRSVFGPQGPVYGPKIAQYKATQAGLMGEREAAQKGAEEAGKGVQALAGVTGRTIYGGAHVESAQVNAAQRAQAVVTQHQTALERIAAMKDINQRNVAAREEIARMHDEVMAEIAKAGNVTKEDVAGIMASSAQTILNTKIAEDPSLAGYVKQLFGIGGAQAPGGAQPERGNAPLPKRGNAPPSKTPARPKGVPADAKYDAKTNTWYR